jgi:hypothetical protein
MSGQVETPPKDSSYIISIGQLFNFWIASASSVDLSRTGGGGGGLRRSASICDIRQRQQMSFFKRENL